MAVMIPAEGPRDYEAASGEGLLYDALTKLPDDYYVVHSLDILSTKNGEVRENEADFVIFNPSLGMLCIEAKAGQVSYSGGVWRYASGLPMKHGGPYRQAANIQYRLIDRFNDQGLSAELRQCRIHHAVWFHNISRQQLAQVDLPPEASLDITLCRDDLDDPEPMVRRILSMQTPAGNETNLTSAQAEEVISKVICPEFEIVPTRRYRYDIAENAFAHLLASQARILNFMVDQKTAVINGAAGTGKTLIAMEHARRFSAEGSHVLFLCFNAMLKDSLEKNLADSPNVRVFSIAGYACHALHTSSPDYQGLGERLLECCDQGDFPYEHVVIDEGQDFGIKEIDEADILDLLKAAVLKKGGTFYLFYDRNQLIQGSGIPAVIEEADCKMTLYVNCRNTKTIAECASRSIGLESGKVIGGLKKAGPPLLVCTRDAEKQAEFISSEISSFRDLGLDVVVLTCKTERTTVLAPHVRQNGDRSYWEGSTVPFTTCRKFKGLEADAIILVDVDQSVWAAPSFDYQPDSGLIFYTGASRAKYELRIVCDMDDDGCVEALSAMGATGVRKPASKLAKRLGAIYCAL